MDAGSLGRSPRPRRPGPFVAILATLTVIVLAAIVSTAGPIDTFTPGTGGIDLGTPDTEPQRTIAEVQPSEPAAIPDSDPAWAKIMRIVVAAIVVICVVVALSAIARALMRAREAHRRRREELMTGEFAPPSAHDELVDALDQGLQRFDHLPVEDAIIACWIRLEAAAADAGIARHDAETATELTARVLAAHAVSPSAVRELLALYNEARYSRHELGEPDRRRARAALEQLRDELADRARRVTAAPSPVSSPAGSSGAAP